MALRADRLPRGAVEVPPGNGDRLHAAAFATRPPAMAKRDPTPSISSHTHDCRRRHLAGGTRWAPCRRGFFLPVPVLPALFRRLMIEKCAAAHRAGKLKFFGEHARLACEHASGRPPGSA
jgi:hypothetical protein